MAQKVEDEALKADIKEIYRVSNKDHTFYKINYEEFQNNLHKDVYNYMYVRYLDLFYCFLCQFDSP